MEQLKVIKSLQQYNAYCDELERLTSVDVLSAALEDRMELLVLLIEKWDEDHATSEALHPVEMLKHLMQLHQLQAADLSRSTGIDKTVLSKIINYKKGFSKEVIRQLAAFFKVQQEAFNRPYLVGEKNQPPIHAQKGNSA